MVGWNSERRNRFKQKRWHITNLHVLQKCCSCGYLVIVVQIFPRSPRQILEIVACGWSGVNTTMFLVSAVAPHSILYLCSSSMSRHPLSRNFDVPVASCVSGLPPASMEQGDSAHRAAVFFSKNITLTFLTSPRHLAYRSTTHSNSWDQFPFLRRRNPNRPKKRANTCGCKTTTKQQPAKNRHPAPLNDADLVAHDRELLDDPREFQSRVQLVVLVVRVAEGIGWCNEVLFGVSIVLSAGLEQLRRFGR